MSTEVKVYTTAPADYDYSCVLKREETNLVDSRDRPVYLLTIDEEWSANRLQMRFGSGLHASCREHELDTAPFRKLNA